MTDQRHDDPALGTSAPGTEPARPAPPPGERPVPRPRQLTRAELETLRERLQKKFH